MLPEIDIPGQDKINKKSIAFVGMGGLGCAASTYCVLSGFGKVEIFDFDLVEESNLQRQTLFNLEDISKNKALVAKKKLESLNPLIKLSAHKTKITKKNIDSLLKNSDIILDCSDNFETRKIVNNFCFEHSKILISGSSIGWQGQLACLDLRKNSNPCYECIFEDLEDEDLSCRESAIASPLVGIIGSLMAVEAIKGAIEKNFHSSFIDFDGLNGEFKKINIKKNPNCKKCKI